MDQRQEQLPQGKTSQVMRVFLSWSGTTSQLIAEALHKWIPLIIQNAKPFLSSGDIDKGKRWGDVVGRELSESDYGIVFITRYNCGSTWLHFEAGAISRALGKASVSPLLYNVEPSHVDGPFRQFQMTMYSPDAEERSKHEMLGLFRSLNQRMMPELQLTDATLKAEFEKWWPDLKKDLDDIKDKKDGATHTPYQWLYAFEDLLNVQSQDVKQVWWITPNPYVYALQPEAKKIIWKKLREGTSYTFLMSRESSKTAKRELLQIRDQSSSPKDPQRPRDNPVTQESHTTTHGESGGNKYQPASSVSGEVAHFTPGTLTILETEDAEFTKSAVTDYVVIDPDNNLQVFLDLPLAHYVGPDHASQGFWVEVVKEVAAGFYERFKGLKNVAELSNENSAFSSRPASVQQATHEHEDVGGQKQTPDSGDRLGRRSTVTV
jgi:hypothetical protein